MVLPMSSTFFDRTAGHTQKERPPALPQAAQV
jgi:hypothetical protein